MDNYGNIINGSKLHAVTLENGNRIISTLNPNAKEFVPDFSFANAKTKLDMKSQDYNLNKNNDVEQLRETVMNVLEILTASNEGLKQCRLLIRILIKNWAKVISTMEVKNSKQNIPTRTCLIKRYNPIERIEEEQSRRWTESITGFWQKKNQEIFCKSCNWRLPLDMEKLQLIKAISKQSPCFFLDDLKERAIIEKQLNRIVNVKTSRNLKKLIKRLETFTNNKTKKVFSNHKFRYLTTSHQSLPIENYPSEKGTQETKESKSEPYFSSKSQFKNLSPLHSWSNHDQIQKGLSFYMKGTFSSAYSIPIEPELTAVSDTENIIDFNKDSHLNKRTSPFDCIIEDSKTEICELKYLLPTKSEFHGNDRIGRFMTPTLPESFQNIQIDSPPIVVEGSSDLPQCLKQSNKKQEISQTNFVPQKTEGNEDEIALNRTNNKINLIHNTTKTYEKKHETIELEKQSNSNSDSISLEHLEVKEEFAEPLSDQLPKTANKKQVSKAAQEYLSIDIHESMCQILQLVADGADQSKKPINISPVKLPVVQTLPEKEHLKIPRKSMEKKAEKKSAFTVFKKTSIPTPIKAVTKRTATTSLLASKNIASFNRMQDSSLPVPRIKMRLDTLHTISSLSKTKPSIKKIDVPQKSVAKSVDHSLRKIHLNAAQNSANKKQSLNNKFPRSSKTKTKPVNNDQSIANEKVQLSKHKTNDNKTRIAKQPIVRETVASSMRITEINRRRYVFPNTHEDKANIVYNDFIFK